MSSPPLISRLSREIFRLTKYDARLSSIRTISNTAIHVDNEEATVKPFSEIPGPKGLPYLGAYLRYKFGRDDIAKFKDVLLERFEQYGPIVKETVAGKTIVYVFDPDMVRTVYAQDGSDPHIPPLLGERKTYRAMNDMSPGLGNTNGEEWLRLRNAANQMMMRPLSAAEFLPATNEVVNDFISKIKTTVGAKGEVLDFENEMAKWILESSGKTVLGLRLGCLEAREDSLAQKLINANMASLENSVKLKFALPIYKFINTPTFAKFCKAEEFFFGQGQILVDETVNNIRRLFERGELKEDEHRFLVHLMSRKGLSYKDLSMITLSSFGDGLSTTLPITIGQMYCLAKNPDAQEAAYEEISKVVPRDKPVTLEMLNKLQYLKACFKEGFRFFPLQSDVQRIAKKDFTLHGYHIPAGTTIGMANNIVLRCADYIDEPEVYNPKRWLRGTGSPNVHPYLLIPFSHGARMCIGRRLAEQEMYTFICRLLQNFRIEWPHSHSMSQFYNIILWPDKKARFKFVRR